ncbi:hypothetical protein AB4Y42_05495 [Paraburkholderia sp. EG286B]|uniref:hypothetical protein n=1 Tax=Paraburkholderia sp. EG286B TaxID=3237011 RepID=UPI0034D26DDE
MQRAVHGIRESFVRLIASGAPYAHAVSPEIEIRTEIDWKNPREIMASACAGVIALVKIYGDDGAVIDIEIDNVIAFATRRYARRRIAIRNQLERETYPDYMPEEAEPITAAGAERDDIAALAFMLPDGSVTCAGIRYAAFEEMLDARRKLILTAQ